MQKTISLFFLIVLISCELIVDVDVPFDKAQVTLNSFFNPDSLWSANLSLNKHILNDMPFQEIEDGVVVIYHEGIPVDTLVHQGNGAYKSDTGKPVAGATYEIMASVPNYGTVTSQARIPVAATITNVEVTKGDRLPDGSLNTQIHITFQDNGAETNYYHINVEEEFEFYDLTTETVRTFRNPFYVESEDPSIRDQNINWTEGVLLKDVYFNGKEIEIPFKVTYSDFTQSAAVIVSLRTVGEDYYAYKTTYQLQENADGDPFSQPVYVYTNVEDGFGVFAGFSKSDFVYQNTPKPIITGVSPLAGKPGDHVIITGENFGKILETPGNVAFVKEHYAYASIVRATESEIEVVIPDQATTGKILVSTGGRVAVSEAIFEVIR